MDGNRRWACQAGFGSASDGHEHGARKVRAGRPDPELIIRTGGEQRLSDFLLWQGVRSELWFCDAYWPALREVDFLRALRGHAARQGPC